MSKLGRMNETSKLYNLTRRTLLKAGAALTVGVGLASGYRAHTVQAQGQTDNVVVQWNNAALQAIRTTAPAPTVASRALAILHTCMYDAWTAYDLHALPTRPQQFLRRTYNEQDITIAVSYAAYRALVDLFPSTQAFLTAQMQAAGYDPNDTSSDTTTPVGVGNVAAQAVLSYRRQDGANQLGNLHPGAYSDYTNYTPINTPDAILNPDYWQPLCVPDGKGGFVVQHYATPHWGNVKPFALASASQFRPTNGPARYGQSEYIAQAKQLLRYSAMLNDTMKTIADYWEDGPHSETPPGHWTIFCQFMLLHEISRQLQHSTSTAIQSFFVLANAVFDASIACWECKRHYNSVRPITAIHYLFRGQQIAAWGGIGKGTVWMDGSQWLPYQAATIVTPPFPEYVSGHSTFSAAGAVILQRLAGSDLFGASFTAVPGSSDIEPGIAPEYPVYLFWGTYTDVAEQAGISRRYGGIHFQRADLEGRALGRKVAEVVWRKAQKLINGTEHYPFIGNA